MKSNVAGILLGMALQKWSDVADIKFSRVSKGPADILVQFGPGYHHCPYRFDGPGGTLAHAYYPSDNEGEHCYAILSCNSF